MKRANSGVPMPMAVQVQFRTRSLFAILALMICSNFAKAQNSVGDGAEPIVKSIDPAALAYDYLVDGNLAQDDPAARKFKTLQAAYAAAPAGTEAKPTVIGIEPNVYHIAGSMEPGASLSITKNWITLLGLTNNRRSVVLADDRGLEEGASDDGYLLDVNATGFAAKNLTILNYCNCDYQYPGDPSKDLKMRNPTITQAVALQAAGDKHVYENVAILSRLDTMFLRTTRSYFRNVYIEGTDDWMGGGEMSVWQDCELVYPTGHGVMSASNVVFFNCRFEATRGMEFYKAEYGGATRPDSLIGCVLPAPPARVAWVRGIAAPRPGQYSLTYDDKDASGHPMAICDCTIGAPTFHYSRELSKRELRAYNPWNLLRAAANAEPDDWDPAGVREKYEKAGEGNLVYRIALRIGNMPSDSGAFAAPLSETEPTIRTGGPGMTIHATVLPSDAVDKTVKWSTQSDLVTLSRESGHDVLVSGRNKTEQAQYVPITATASDGFYATAYVYVEPKFINPPALSSAVKLEAPKDGKVRVEYSLDLGGRADQSLITWFACDDASGSNPRKVAVSRGDEPLREYTLMPGDVGKFLRVSVEPKCAISDPGAAVYATAAAPIAVSDIVSCTICPNFRNFVETRDDAPIAGRWLLQGAWTVVAGNNLIDGYGVRAGAGGRGDRYGRSSLFYVKDGDTGDMQVDLVITPNKTEGTVFNIPGSPEDSGVRNSHGDFFIKYDVRSQSGYSLRYWRTTRSAAACMYQFYKIENGVGSPLSDTRVLSGVFKQNTFLTLKAAGSTISAAAHNTVDDQTLNMEATITPNRFGSAGVSVSGAPNIYSRIRISYP